MTRITTSLEYSNFPKRSIRYFQHRLLKWYSKNKRVFAWRKPTLTSYQKIISEILLQRTKAETVSKFYDSFLKKYPSWRALGRATEQDLKLYLKPLGLGNQRGARLYLLTQHMNNFNGRLPKAIEEIESLPMMGQYLVNSIKLLIFNEPAPLLDVNMARVLERYFGSRKLADIRYDPYLQELAYLVTQHKKIKEINWAILDFAAAVCKARNPRCPTCPLNESCTYFITQKSRDDAS